MNTTDRPVFIDDFTPKIEPLKIYNVFKNIKTNSSSNRVEEILKNLNIDDESPQIPGYALNSLKKLVSEYNDIFYVKGDHLTTNNFYSQCIHLKDQIPVYIPNYKPIHSQQDEINEQVK